MEPKAPQEKGNVGREARKQQAEGHAEPLWESGGGEGARSSGDVRRRVKVADDPMSAVEAAEAAEAVSQIHVETVMPSNTGGFADVFRSCVSHEEMLRRVIAMAPADFTRTEMNIMVMLNAVGPLAMTPLSECLAVSKEQVSRAVKPLVKRGYVERRRSEKNRRVVTVRLTEEGSRFLDGHMKNALAAMENLLEPLSEEEYGRLVELSRESDSLLAKALEPRRNPYSVE